MITEFHRFIDKVVQQIDGNEEEKADLREELTIHLELSYAEFIKNGYDKEAAKQQAMKNFGIPNEIGNDIQQAMFPYRKAMLLTLAVTSFIYSFIVYLAHLFINGDAHIVWLIISVISSSVVALFALQVLPSLDRKRWLNATLIFHITIYLIGTGIALGPFTYTLVVLILLLSIILIYRTAMYQYESGKNLPIKQIRWLHFLNISVGLTVIGMTLFFLWGIYAFGGPDTFPYVITIPLLIWLVAYYSQMKFIVNNQKKVAYAITTLPILLFIGVTFLAFQIFFVM